MWDWCPRDEEWQDFVQAEIDAWVPSHDVFSSPDAIKTACSNLSPDILNCPQLGPMLRPLRPTLEDEVRFVVWMACSSGTDLGQMELPRDVVSHSGIEPIILDRGVHQLSRFKVRVDDGPVLDPFLASVGSTIPPDLWPSSDGTWLNELPPSEDVGMRLTTSLYCVRNALDAIRRHSALAFAWVTGATQVLVPLVPGQSNSSRSASSPCVPGCIAIDVDSNIGSVAELIVHETAHNYVYRHEFNAPLVDPDHKGLYPSSLRDDPRPLRGLLLAAHALLYILGIYDLLSDELVHAEVERDSSRHELDKSITDLLGAREHLTQRGLDFLDRLISEAEVAV